MFRTQVVPRRHSKGFGAVPRENVLVFVEVRLESFPIIPVFLESIEDVGVIMPSGFETKEIFFRQAIWDVILGANKSGIVALHANRKVEQMVGL